ncbi:MAG: hypothetical protein J7K68_03355, partial [Candidatus Diapherotrites archaeon]|nr:hypothetical protein [Candidatus Diapherotrites archaeon]
MKSSLVSAVFIVLLLSCVYGITVVANLTDGTKILAEENYVVRVNTKNNVFSINNLIDIPIFPVAKVGGKSIEVPEPTEPDVHVGDTLSVYTVDFSEGFGNNVYVSS